MYDALQAAGAKADLLLIEGAEHADHHFVQTFVKQRVLEFLNENMK